MRFTAFAAATLFTLSLAGCASSDMSDEKSAASVNVTEPVVHLEQLSTVAEAARHVTGGLPIKYRVQVENQASEPITLTRVAVQSIGEGAYTLPNNSQPFKLEVPPQTAKSADFWVPAIVQNDTVYGSNGPVSIRVTAYFDSAKGAFQHTTVEQVHYSPVQGQ
jgi:outer membrane murein-binding lipoprotein Lpp